MIERRKISHQVLEEMKKLIKNKEFPVNEKLPSETELAERFGVSRAPVREALSVLAASGIVESKQGGGSWVRPLPIEDLLKETSLEVMGTEEILYLIETRIILEREAASLAANRRTLEDIEEIKQAQHKLTTILADPDEIGDEADFQFHRSIIKASHNPVLLKTLDNISGLYNKAMKFSLELNKQIRGKKEQVLKEHDAILTAIEKNRADDANRAMEEHLVNSRKKLQAFL
ncbi:FadR/GntR family transcriptional regulator [Alteribacillus sp. HJP-4]|uniref:FadR/GntR family transcriptional regulator n=1 Tax=Alteribacillus sp. HJP-4 TaxID=2775394 RepID=UPI0035CD3AAB